MSTIASPRDSSIPRHNKLPTVSTPTSSSRPSIDSPSAPPIRSADASPSRNNGLPVQLRRNRTALREYYNLKKEERADDVGSEYSINYHSDVLESEMDREGFEAETYVKHVLESQSLEELLKTYNQVLTDIRALDAEKKALVYDNYSKLISATETIRRMRANMDPLNPMAATLSPAIVEIYERAESLKAELRRSTMTGKGGGDTVEEEEKDRRKRTEKETGLVRFILGTPERLRMLVADGREEEAKKEWEGPVRLLRRWKERGVGGVDVDDCIEDGEAALRGEPPGEKSWVNLRSKR